jgi:hypothetical protein
MPSSTSRLPGASCSPGGGGGGRGFVGVTAMSQVPGTSVEDHARPRTCFPAANRHFTDFSGRMGPVGTGGGGLGRCAGRGVGVGGSAVVASGGGPGGGGLRGGAGRALRAPLRRHHRRRAGRRDRTEHDGSCGAAGRTCAAELNRGCRAGSAHAAAWRRFWLSIFHATPCERGTVCATEDCSPRRRQSWGAQLVGGSACRLAARQASRIIAGAAPGLTRSRVCRAHSCPAVQPKCLAVPGFLN